MVRHLKKIFSVFFSLVIIFPLSSPQIVNASSSEYQGITTHLLEKDDSSFQNTIYCSTSAKQGENGSSTHPMTLEEALTLSQTTSGISILLKSGTYKLDNQLTILNTNNGSSNQYKVLKAAKNADVTLDFSSEPYNMKDTSANPRGIQMEGSNWYIGGIRIKGASDNGLFLAGKNNVIESCIFEGNRDSGLQISRRSSSISDSKDWPSDNVIINCTSFDNNDPATGENADGFASKLTCGDGNVFDGCMAYNNVDDGWDLFAKSATGPIGLVTIRNCIAFRNGATSSGEFTKNSDGNGFKLGGSGIGTPHIVKNCISFENKKHGFTDNNNPTAVSLTNCTSYKNGAGDSNGANFQMDRTKNGGIYKNLLDAGLKGQASDKFIGTIENSIYYNSKEWRKVDKETLINKDNPGDVISAPEASEFISLSSPSIGTDFDELWRNADSTLNTKGFLIPSSETNYENMGALYGTGGNTYKIPVIVK